jgi:hypothetical protein
VLIKEISGEIILSREINDFFVTDRGLRQNPISMIRKDPSSILCAFNNKPSSNSTIGFGCNPTNLNCSDTSHIPLQPFYNQLIIDNVKQINPEDSQSIKKSNGIENKLDLIVKQNPLNLFGLFSISFSDIKTKSAELLILSIDGFLMRRIHLSIGQNCISLSKKFLPAGMLCIMHF